MSRLALLLLFCVLLPTLAFGQPNKVDIEDLAPIADDLSTLTDPIFAVFASEVQLVAAKARVEQAKGARKAAERLVDAEEADKDAAESEKKAAEKNSDELRMDIAERRIQITEEDLETAKAFKEWKNAEVKYYESLVDEAEAIKKLRDAEFELAKGSLVVHASAEAAAKYSVESLRSRVIDAKKKTQDRKSKQRKEREKEMKAKAEWQKLSEKPTGS